MSLQEYIKVGASHSTTKNSKYVFWQRKIRVKRSSVLDFHSYIPSERSFPVQLIEHSIKPMASYTVAPGAYSTVLYPSTPSLSFDMDYYLATHMPLCAQLWGPHGLLSWQVIRFEKHPDGSDPPYAVQAILHWDKAESLKVVTDKSVSGPIFEDVQKFSSETPVFRVGRWSGRSG
jgi:uncharacterized protein (TIGR02118 family)